MNFNQIHYAYIHGLFERDTGKIQSIAVFSDERPTVADVGREEYRCLGKHKGRSYAEARQVALVELWRTPWMHKHVSPKLLAEARQARI